MFDVLFEKNADNINPNDTNPDSNNFIDINISKNAPKGGGVPNGLDYKPSEIKKLSINGISMTKLTDDLYATFGNGYGFFIQDFSNTDPSVRINFDKILQTFKFLN